MYSYLEQRNVWRSRFIKGAALIRRSTSEVELLKIGNCERAQRASYLVVSMPRFFYISTGAAFLNGRCSDLSKPGIKTRTFKATHKSNFAMCDTRTRTFHAAALARNNATLLGP